MRISVAEQGLYTYVPVTSDIAGLQEGLRCYEPMRVHPEANTVVVNERGGEDAQSTTVQVEPSVTVPHTVQEMPSQTALAVLETSVNSELSLVPGWTNTIVSSYVKFKDTKDITLLPSCINALSAFESYYKDLYEKDPDQAVLIKKDLEEMRRQVQEMNMASPVPTYQDVVHMTNLFTKPTEAIFIDNLTNKKYVQPDHSRLLTAGAPFFKDGGYCGMGLMRERRLSDGRMCDVLYLIKQNDQIQYEKPRNLWSSFIDSLLSQNQAKERELQARIACQEKLFCEVNCGVETFKKFGYSEFITVRDDHDLSRRLGMGPEASNKQHMVFFIYQEIKETFEIKE